MKVGILTYHWVSNFGANLQALSTYSYLEKQGHDPIIIDWVPKDLENYYTRVVKLEQNESHHTFAERHFRSITARCRTCDDVANEIVKNGIELVVIGSDAVFTYIPFLRRFHLTKRGFVYSKPLLDSDFPNPYWGSFADKIPESVKICAMSASAQNTDYKYILNKNDFSRAIQRFSYISVRDIWTQKMVSFLTGHRVCPAITPDPVFAFEQNVAQAFGKEYVVNKFSLPDRYVLISVSDIGISESWYYGLSQIFEKNGYELVSLDQTNKKVAHRMPNHLSLPMDPLEWYSLIKHSSGYIGELMHPILVSLHNAVPVFAMDTYGFRKGRSLDVLSSKTYQILSRFDLLKNYYNKKYNSLPDATDVAEAILNFNHERCRTNARDMQNQYNEMMQNILSI